MSAVDAASVVVRTLGPDDLTSLSDLETDAFGEEAWVMDTLADVLRGEGRRGVVAVGGEEVLGYAVSRVADDVVDLERVVVRRDARRRGVATLLLADLVSHGAGVAGVDRMLLEVSALNRGAVAFYAAHGFGQIDVRPRYYRDGSDALVMRRSLTRGCGGSRS